MHRVLSAASLPAALELTLFVLPPGPFVAHAGLVCSVCEHSAPAGTRLAGPMPSTLLPFSCLMCKVNMKLTSGCHEEDILSLAMLTRSQRPHSNGNPQL